MRPEPVSHVALLADHPDLIPDVAEMRWRDWGLAPEPEELAWWTDVTRSESGRTELPVTFIGLDAGGALAGVAGINHFDPPELRDRGPWVIGVIVDPALRGLGAGRVILAHTVRWAADQGYDQVWVATGPAAVGFYQSCGWELAQTYPGQQGKVVMILRISLPFALREVRRTWAGASRAGRRRPRPGPDP